MTGSDLTCTDLGGFFCGGGGLGSYDIEKKRWGWFVNQPIKNWILIDHPNGKNGWFTVMVTGKNGILVGLPAGFPTSGVFRGLVLRSSRKLSTFGETGKLVVDSLGAHFLFGG